MSINLKNIVHLASKVVDVGAEYWLEITVFILGSALVGVGLSVIKKKKGKERV